MYDALHVFFLYTCLLLLLRNNVNACMHASELHIDFFYQGINFFKDKYLLKFSNFFGRRLKNVCNHLYDECTCPFQEKGLKLICFSVEPNQLEKYVIIYL